MTGCTDPTSVVYFSSNFSRAFLWLQTNNQCTAFTTVCVKSQRKLGNDVTFPSGRTENIIRTAKFGGGASHPSLYPVRPALTLINTALRAVRARYALAPSVAHL